VEKGKTRREKEERRERKKTFPTSTIWPPLWQVGKVKRKAGEKKEEGKKKERVEQRVYIIQSIISYRAVLLKKENLRRGKKRKKKGSSVLFPLHHAARAGEKIEEKSRKKGRKEGAILHYLSQKKEWKEETTEKG